MNSNSEQAKKQEVAVFGGGCFWCTEAVFSELKGVIDVAPGYAGGTFENPTYNDVCSGETGHAEVVKITFNPDIIQYEQLLEVFFKTHDPTTINQQGADIGTQYRSVIFYTSAEQEKIAKELISKLNTKKVFTKPIITEVSQLTHFYEAEKYHHNYFKNNPHKPYCQFVIKQKIEKTRNLFSPLIEIK
jgi:peptide-methionine (S)-S-oxide reductase